ncbi:MAG: hypothetical protein KatS3mg109_0142 [Pirellulaceae bacterium]|nr:MAG: hypothetical protein KatS3mg109_0142 [Pirellulaceae bacterium]
MTYVLGVDNGFKGFACLVHARDRSYAFARTPLCSPPLIHSEFRYDKQLDDQDYDVEKMLRIAKAAYRKSGGHCYLVIEDTISTHSGGRVVNQTSARSRDSLMTGKVAWCTVARLAGLRPFVVTPRRWKSKMGLLKAEKEASIELAQSMGVELPTIGKRRDGSPKYSHDAADAYLLASWFIDHSKVMHHARAEADDTRSSQDTSP